MRFFFDNCISVHLADAFDLLDHRNEVVHLTHKFHASTADEVWIPALAKDGKWVIVSGDVRITRQKEPRKAWMESGMTAFFFSGKSFAQLNHWKQVEVMAKWWPLIIQEARDYRISAKGDGYLMPVNSMKFKHIPRDK